MTQERTLCSLRPGECGRVRALRVFGPMRRRLRALGLVEGAELCCLGRSPLGDPRAYSLYGAVLALREREGSRILLERKEESDGACDCPGGAAERGKKHGL